MVAATETPDSAGERLEQARDGAEWGWGEVARLWVRGIEAEWRGAVDAELGGGSSSPLRDANARKEKGEAKPETAPGRFEGVRASAKKRRSDVEVGRDCRRVDALAGDHGGGMGVGAQCRAQEGHCLLV